MVTHLWVAENCRSQGLGRWLLESAEAEALRRNCSQVILSTHSFQAPGFYERQGFAPVASVQDWPAAHSPSSKAARRPSLSSRARRTLPVWWAIRARCLVCRTAVVSAAAEEKRRRTMLSRNSVFHCDRRL